MKWDNGAQDWYWPDSDGVPPMKVDGPKIIRREQKIKSLTVGDIL